jgi:hypothetical protein
VPSVDQELNPVSIRVTYEVESGGARFAIYGAEGTLALAPQLAVGGSFVRDEDPTTPRDVIGGHATWRPLAGISFSGEFAHSDSGGTSLGEGPKQGDAWRGEMRVEHARVHASAFALRLESGFENPSAGVVPGRQELGFRGTAVLDSATNVFAQALWTEDIATGGYRDGVDAGLNRRLGSMLTVEGAYRWVEETTVAASPATAATAPNDMSSVRGKLTAQLPGRWRTSAFGELEQDLERDDARRIAVGGEAQLPARTRLYAKAEDIGSFGGPFALNQAQQLRTIVVGLASDELREGHVFSEYRARDAFSGRETQAAIGLRNRWTVSPGVRLDGGFERVEAIRGGSGTSTAVSGGLEFTAGPLWKGTARAEYRTQTGGEERWLASGGAARKLSRDWTTLARSTWLIVPASEQMDGRSQIGFAWRQTDRNVWNALGRYENRYEKSGVGAARVERGVNIVSGHANWRASTASTFNAHVAGKWVGDERGGIKVNTNAQLLGGRAMVDLTRRLDGGVSARLLTSHDFAAKQYGLGGEAGWLMGKNVRLAAGYNVFGFRDDDIAGSERTDHGPYLRIGVKFDEYLFEGWQPAPRGNTP